MKPRLLVVADTYYPQVDGTLRFMEEFLPRAKKDFELSLLVPLFGKQKKLQEGIPITFIDTSRWISLSGYALMKLSWKNIKNIRKAVAQNDILFIQGPALISYLATFFGQRYRKRTITYIHVIPWELYEQFLPPLVNRLVSFFVKRLSIWLFNQSHLVIVPYAGLQQELRQSGVHSPIEVAKLGVDITRFTPLDQKELLRKKLSLPPEAFVIGYVGRISTEKNITLLVEAFQQAHIQRKILLLVGAGEPATMERYRHLPHIRVTGFVTNVEDYLKAMDVFVMPSLTETTSLATLEAMSSGLPVVVTKVGFMKNYITKENGLFFPKNDAQVLTAKIEKLYQDESLRRSLGRQARKTIAYAFSWERSINRIKTLLQKA